MTRKEGEAEDPQEKGEMGWERDSPRENSQARSQSRQETKSELQFPGLKLEKKIGSEMEARGGHQDTQRRS